MVWKLLDHVDDYPDGEPFHHRDHQRVYGWDGAQWPKLTVTIYEVSPLALTREPVVGEPPLVGWKVSCSAQKSPEHWWHDDYPLPIELFGDLITLLEQVRASGV